jgi:dUTP pyrophosphatase
MKVKIKKFRDNAQVPQKMTEGAACFDVFASEIEWFSKEGFTICKLGVGMTPPKGYKIVFVPRSSITKYNWVLQNSPFQGDEDFIGEYQLRFRCLPRYNADRDRFQYEDFPYKVGDRIGQMFIEQVIDFEFEEVDELTVTERGEGGFGSSGN